MKIISFGDIHEDTQNLEKIKDKIEEADIVIVSGDLTNYHGKAEAKNVIDRIRKYNDKIFAQLGNLDQSDVNEYLSSENINIHGNGFICDDVGIFGVGGSNETPFNTPTEYSEDELLQFLNIGYSKIKDSRVKIMVPHTPPKDTKADLIPAGVHVGSKSVRDFIEEFKPDVCICGHIHEARSKDMIGDTIIVNAGMFKAGGYIEVVCEGGNVTADVKMINW